MIISILSSPYSSSIDTQGAAIATVQKNGVDLVEPRIDPSFYGGVALAPWPNRVANGKYVYEGQEFNPPINEVAKKNALHGLVADCEWDLVSKSDNQVVLGTKVPPSGSYPTELTMTMTYTLSDAGLKCDLKTVNTGTKNGPYGASTHPYFVVPGLTSVNDYYLKIGASSFLEVNERLLPTELTQVSARDFDFRAGKQIGDKAIDHAFKIDNPGNGHVDIYSANGAGARISFDKETKWVQIHTADRGGGPSARTCLAVEPMTCPPDAFNSGVDLIHLKPGDSHTYNWTISAI